MLRFAMFVFQTKSTLATHSEGDSNEKEHLCMWGSWVGGHLIPVTQLKSHHKILHCLGGYVKVTYPILTPLVWWKFLSLGAFQKVWLRNRRIYLQLIYIALRPDESWGFLISKIWKLRMVNKIAINDTSNLKSRTLAMKGIFLYHLSS